MVLQAVLLLVLVAMAVAMVSARLPGDRGRMRWGSACGVLAVLAASAAAWSLAEGRSASRFALNRAVPDPAPDAAGFVTSAACRSCHPGNHASWAATYHDTMTQRASPASVLGDFGNVVLSAGPRTFKLTRRGDEYWVDMVDPDWEEDLRARGLDPERVPQAPRKSKRIVMTTGSHHMQTYWVGSDRDGRLFNFPFTWLNDEARWTPRDDVFLRPPDAGRGHVTWHDNCVECHAVAGEQGHDAEAGTWSPEAAELGIACEACHGPGAEHVQANSSPWRRWRQRASGEPDPTIVNPERLSARASSQVCGQCHGMNLFKGNALKAGDRYRAGGDLTQTRIVLRAHPDHLFDDEREDWLKQQRHVARQNATYMEERFWSDGMVRVSGREHNAMIESPCFQGGELSCLTCHSMHDAPADDQLAADKAGDEACLACHEPLRGRVAEHSHHPPGPGGVSCYDCHMPHTTYGLLKAIRSHQIDVPNVAVTVATGRPNACNLCHLDQSLEWTSRQLAGWMRWPERPADQPDTSVSAGATWLLSGNANQRALVAWHAGWAPARAASGEDWLTPLLATLLDGPYAAVRYVAQRSLKQASGFEGLEYDHSAAPAARRLAATAALKQWESARTTSPDRHGPAVLLRADGSLDVAEADWLRNQRDDRRMDLRE